VNGVNSYKRLCTEFYDIDKPAPPEDAFNFFLHYAERANGPILEPMCGSGRFLIPLLERGFDIDGVDASPYMLQACREGCSRKGLKPVLHEQFLERIEMPRRYSLVIIPAGSFCLITEQSAIEEGLRRIYELMLPQSTFVLEIERLPSPLPLAGTGSWSGRWVERPDGAKIIISWLSEYNERERISRSIHRYDLCRDSELVKTEFEDFDLRFYDQAEFHDLLIAAGFRDIKTFKAYQFRAPDDNDESLIFECVRP
jgi:SAM-dependent methyltransferase